jgi:hypothetical protein
MPLHVPATDNFQDGGLAIAAAPSQMGIETVAAAMRILAGGGCNRQFTILKVISCRNMQGHRLFFHCYCDAVCTKPAFWSALSKTYQSPIDAIVQVSANIAKSNSVLVPIYIFLLPIATTYLKYRLFYFLNRFKLSPICS